MDSTDTFPWVLHLPLLFLQNGLDNTCTLLHPGDRLAPASNVAFDVGKQNPTVAYASNFWVSSLPWTSSTPIWTCWDLAPCGGKAEQWKMVASSYFLSSPKLLFKDAAIITMPVWRGLVGLSHQPPLEQYPRNASCSGLQEFSLTDVYCYFI